MHLSTPLNLPNLMFTSTAEINATLLGQGRIKGEKTETRLGKIFHCLRVTQRQEDSKDYRILLLVFIKLQKPTGLFILGMVFKPVCQKRDQFVKLLGINIKLS